MSEWKPIETAPMGAHDDLKTHFIGGRIDLRRDRTSVARCYRNEHGAYEWWGGGMTPTHWMPMIEIPSPPKEKAE